MLYCHVEFSHAYTQPRAYRTEDQDENRSFVLVSCVSFVGY